MVLREILNSLLPSLAEVQEYLVEGGYVVIPIAVLSLAVWFLLGLRFLGLRRGTSGPVADLVDRPSELMKGGEPAGVVTRAVVLAQKCVADSGEKNPHDALEELFYDEERALGRYRRGIQAITMAAPLLGLLGTVSGMIETFGSLMNMAFFTQSGGIAGGISEALITTQMGLFVAIPSLILGRLLDQKEERLRKELRQVKKRFYVKLRLDNTGVEA